MNNELFSILVQRVRASVARELTKEIEKQFGFLVELDLMIESTEEFIRDDGLRADDERIHDLSALLRVRDLYTTTFAPQEDQ